MGYYGELFSAECLMYLDTDIILALVKETDWLKPHINLDLIKDPKTSVFAIIEAELIMDREYGREFVQTVLKTIEANQIKIIPLDEKTTKKSAELLAIYSQLNIFDSVH